MIPLTFDRQFFDMVFDSIQDGISILDPDLNIIRVNQAMERWYRHRMPLAGKKCYHVYNQRSEPCTVCPSRRALQTGLRQMEVVPFVGPHGDQGWQELYAFPLIDSSGKITGVIEYVRDITDRKLAEAGQHESEEKFRMMADLSPNMIFINQRGRIIYVNKKCMEVMEYRYDEFLAPGFDFMNLVDPAFHDQTRVAFQRHADRQEVIPYEYRLVTKSGKKVDCVISTKLMRLSNEYSILGVITDITAQKQAQKQLLAEKEHAQQYLDIAGVIIVALNTRGEIDLINKKGCEVLERTHEELLHADWFETCLPETNRGHIRSLLTDLVVGKFPEPLPPNENEIMTASGETRIILWHNVVLRNLDRLVAMIENLLNFSRLELQSEKISLSTFDLVSLIRETAAILTYKSSQKNIRVDLRLPAAELMVTADHDKLFQVFTNILDNALKFSANDSVVTMAVNSQAGPVSVIITDTGCGIAADDIPQIFKRFFQVRPAASTGAKGLGIGLTIADEIIRLHHGTIRVSSPPGQGATFTITLPR